MLLLRNTGHRKLPYKHEGSIVGRHTDSNYEVVK